MRGVTVRPMIGWTILHADLRSVGLTTNTRYRGQIVLYVSQARAIGAEAIAVSELSGRRRGAVVDDADLRGERAVAWRMPDGVEIDHSPLSAVIATGILESVHEATHPACDCPTVVSDHAWHGRLGEHLDVLNPPIPVAKGQLGLWRPSKELRSRLR